MTEMEMIEGIPRFECSDGRPLEFEDDFFKDKLKKALTNTDIICLARGEGRNSVLNDIVFHPEILFDCGEKSVHAFLEAKDEKFRRFCDPEIVDREVLIYYIGKYSERLRWLYFKYHFKCNETDVNAFEKRLIKQVRTEKDNEKLLCIHA